MGQTLAPAARSACALALAIILAISTPIDALAASGPVDLRGGASEPLASSGENPREREGAETPSNGQPSGQVESEAKLDPPAVSEQHPDTTEQPAATGETTDPVRPSAPSAGQTAADVPLAPEAAKPGLGELVLDGLVYKIDGETAVLVGWRASSLEGDVAVPALVASGADSYAVTSIGEADAKEGVFAGSSVESVSLPASVTTVADGALSGCPTLASVAVGSKNESLASFDGMLFTKDLAELLSIPEGKEGVARIPDQTVTVTALSHCAGLAAVEVGEGSAAFSSRNGLLYTKDMKTLVACPVGAGEAVVVPEGVESIDSGAFAGCAVSSLTALGFVRDIAADAFDAEARASAVVALPAGEDYEARKAVWKAAGFENFKEPAKPGDVSAPEPSEGEGEGARASGLAFEVLDDYTLAVSWQGAEGPEGDLEIPATAQVGGVSYPVGAVADAAFAGRTGLTGVTLPASVTVVGERSFEATGISDMWLPSSVATVGERAFAACPSLERIVSLGSPWVADSALAECSGVSVYAPSESANPWNVGLPAAANHLLPYGVDLPEEPLQLEVGQSADLLEGAFLEAPEPIEVSYAYAAKPLSVDPDGTATGKAEGSSEVAVTLALDNVELARASRSVEVAPAQGQSFSDGTSESSSTEDDLNAVDSEQASQADALASDVPGEPNGDGVISHVALLTTGTSFEQKVQSGQTLKFEVLTEDNAAKMGTVSVAKSDDAAYEPSGDILVPSRVIHDGMTYEVTALADRAFTLAWRVTSVSFEADSPLKSIGSYAFNNLMSCQSIEVPSSVTYIAANAFANATGLVSVRIPDSVETIGANAFFRNLALESVQLGAGVKSIPSGAFEYCTGLAEIRANGTIGSIDAKAFSHVKTGDVSVFVVDAEGEASWRAAAATAGYSFKEIVRQTDTCTVVFDAQEGYPARQEAIVGRGMPLKEPATPNRSGASVAGWFTDPGCGEESRWDFSAPVNEDMTLYAKWVEEVRDGQLVYRMRSDGASLSVFAIDPSAVSGHFATPAYHEFGESGSLPVKEIASGGFSLSSVETLLIPNSIEIIGNDAFRQNEKLRSIEFEAGSTLRTIKTDAFRDSALLTSVRIPASVETFGNCVFEKCYSLESVEFEYGSALRALPTYTFRDCTSLREVRLPESLPIIDYGAFLECTGLKSIDLSGVESLAYKAFYGSGLVSVVIPESVVTLEANVFENCKSLADAVIDARLDAIPSATFRLCTALSSVSLPSSVKSFGVSVFHSCPLKTISADGSMPDAGISGVFSAQVKANATVVLPPASSDGSETYATMRDAWKSYGFANIAPAHGSLPTADGTEDGRWELTADGTLRIWCEQPGAVIQDLGWRIGEGATGKHWDPVRGFVKRVDVDPGVDAVNMVKWFVNMPNLVAVDSLTIPPSVVSVSALFSECYSLRELPSGFTMPDTVQTCSHMFQYCSSLVELPDSFRISNNIYDSLNGFSVMFQGCSSLKRLPEGFEIPENTQVSSFSGMFQYCSSLEGLPQGFKLRSKLANAQLYNTFDGCSSLRSLPDGFGLPEGAKQMHNLFNGCSSLEALPDDFRLPESTETAMEMFQGCSSLKRLPDGFELPASILNCGEMFNGCSSLVSLPEGFTMNAAQYCFNMFEGCSSLASLPDGFAISSRAASSEYMFKGCSSLASLPEGFAIPASVTTVEGMFLNCPSLTALPSGFSFPENAPVDPALKVFYCDPTADGARVPLRYAGSDSAILSYDWESQNRTLITSDADMGEWGMRQVKYRVQKIDEAAGFPWETRTTAWTDKRGILADPGNLQLEGYTFSGWCADEACLVPFDFSKPVPEGVTELYGKWLLAGGANERLPLETGTTGDAWWRVAADGTLSIEGSGQVADLQIGAAACTKGYWGPYRKHVTKIEMGEGVRARDMEAWFAQMPKLTDISDFAIPEGTENVQDLFQTCTSLARLPEGFHMPDSMVMATGIFAECTSLETLPESFVLTPNLVYANWMFNNCHALRSLPHGFTLPKTVSRFNFMFQNCTSLTSLPEGFGFEEPANVVNVEFMFNGCTKLTYIPASFKTTGLTAAAKATMGSSFKVPGSVPLETHYAGNLADFQGPDASYWSSQNRKIVSSVPSDTAYVDLMVPNKDTGTYELWMRQPAEVGATLAEPNAFVREGSTFIGWYADAKLETPYDFATGAVPAEGLKLYAKYQANGDSLPTADGLDRASWKLDADGTLRISCEPGAAIVDLGMDGADRRSTAYWGPLRDKVVRVVMDEGVRIEGSMDRWFWNMPNLVDASGAFVPVDDQGKTAVTSLDNLFDACTSLVRLPEGFTVPEGVTSAKGLLWNCGKVASLPTGFSLPSTLANASSMFDGCSSLKQLPASCLLPKNVDDLGGFLAHSGIESLPAGFVLPDGVTDTTSMFQEAKSLKALPDGFAIPASVAEAKFMFFHCEALASLPSTFRIPETVACLDFDNMFSSCTSLKALPEGFSVPAKTTSVEGMFLNCGSLASLPASLDLSGLGSAVGLDGMFALPNAASPVSTYYAGDAARLAASGQDAASYWLSNYSRVLYAETGTDPLPSSLRKVTFLVSNEDGSAPVEWMTTLLSVDATGKAYASQPQMPAKYGYRFSGWFTDPSCSEVVRFDFANTPVGENGLVLYGTYLLRLSADIPLAAKATVEASGEVIPAKFDIVSNTPKDLNVKQVASQAAAGASKLVPKAGDLDKVKLAIGLGDRAVALSVKGGSSKAVAVLDAASAGKPTVLEGSIGLELNGAQVDYQPGDDITSLANLSWTVEAVL